MLIIEILYVNFYTYIVLIWRLILDEYDLDIKYIHGNTNILADASSIFPIKVNQDTTHESTYKK